MKRLTNTIWKVIVLNLILFSSCMPPDFEGNFYYIIENDSDSVIYLNYAYDSSSHESKVIRQHTTDTVTKEWMLNGGEYDLENKFLTEWYSAFDIYKDSLHQIQIQKNYKERNNWEYRSVSRGRGARANGDNYYTLKLINSDI